MNFTGFQPSIRGNLTKTILLGAGVLVLVASLFMDTLIRRFLWERYDADLLNRAEALITLTKHEEEGVELDYAGEFMPGFETEEGPEFFEIWLPDGRLLERSESLIPKAFPVGHEFTEKPQFQNIDLEGVGACRLLRISFIPQKEDEDLEGNLNPLTEPDAAATLLLGRKRLEFDRFLWMIRALIIGSLAALLFLIVILVRLSLNKGLKPLVDIRRQVMAIQPDRLESRIVLKKSVEELTPVVDQLNSLVARLGAAMDRERRFTSDVAHELRTPLAELRTLSEVASRDPNDAAMVLSFFGDVREITLEMQQLVISLLNLSRCDSGNQTVNFEDVNAVGLIDKAWSRAMPLAKERKVCLVREFDQPCWVVSDPVFLEQIIQNLVNNAARYSPPESEIRLGVQGNSQTVTIEIRNLAPDLCDQDLKYMFDPFWQKDSARTGGKNSGLGLALVTSFAKLLVIDVATQLTNGHLVFSLTIPASNRQYID